MRQYLIHFTWNVAIGLNLVSIILTVIVLFLFVFLLVLLLVLLLLIELSKLLVKCPCQDLVPLLDCLLPNLINILMSAFCTDQELLAHPLIAPPGIPGQLLLSVLVKMRIQRGVSNKYHG